VTGGRILPYLIALLSSFLLVAGCATRELKLPSALEPIDPAPILTAISENNALLTSLAVSGKAAIPGESRLVYGARVLAGRGALLELDAGPFLKPILTSACAVGSGCDIFVVDEKTLYRTGDGLQPLLETLLTGRVEVGTGDLSAWRLVDGRASLRRDGGGNYMVAIVGRDGFVDKFYYGNSGERPSAVVEFGERFVVDGGGWYPKSIKVVDEHGDERLLLEPGRVIKLDEAENSLFALRFPPGVKIREGGAEKILKRIGLPSQD